MLPMGSLLSQRIDLFAKRASVPVVHCGTDTITQRHSGSVIIAISDVVNTCPCENELVNSLIKRLDTKRSSANVKLSNVAIACICTLGYAINHNDFPLVTCNDMKRVWGCLETLSVSSSEKLSVWVKSALNGRSQDEYTVTQNVEDNNTEQMTPYAGSSSTVRNMIERPSGSTTELSSSAMSIYFGDTSTVNNTACADSIAYQYLRMCNGASAPDTVGYADARKSG